MAHVLIASFDAHVCEALSTPLRMAGHSVVTISDGALALAALWTVDEPLVAFLDERIGSLATNAIRVHAASDVTPLTRHAYTLISDSHPDASDLTASALMLDAVILPMPHSLWSLLATVQAAEDGLRKREREWSLAPESLSATASSVAER